MHKHNIQPARSFTCMLNVVALLLLLLSSVALATDPPRLGQPVTGEELATMPSHVFADGAGLPKGAGNAVEGEIIYAQHCAGCHGGAGQGGSAMELVGDRDLLASEYPDRGIAVYWPHAPTLFEYVRRAMPPDKPYSLTINEVYAVVAKLLELNGLVSAEQTVDAAFLAKLEMPNKAGFRSVYQSADKPD